MDGGICINEWLIQEGFLVLEADPPPDAAPVRFEDLHVDWSRTRAWGEGGYYGRLFLNVKGREPAGVVAPEDFEAVRHDLASRLESLGDERGRPIGTRCLIPQDLYDNTRGFPPDLIVYFGDLSWRSVGSVGWNAIHVFENDTGPDDANHAQDGMFLYSQGRRDLGGQECHDLHLLQMAPTVLELLDMSVPFDMKMPPIDAVVDQKSRALR